jgi:hypothetical protein
MGSKDFHFIVIYDDNIFISYNKRFIPRYCEKVELRVNLSLNLSFKL